MRIGYVSTEVENSRASYPDELDGNWSSEPPGRRLVGPQVAKTIGLQVACSRAGGRAVCTGAQLPTVHDGTTGSRIVGGRSRSSHAQEAMHAVLAAPVRAEIRMWGQ